MLSFPPPFVRTANTLLFCSSLYYSFGSLSVILDGINPFDAHTVMNMPLTPFKRVTVRYVYIAEEIIRCMQLTALFLCVLRLFENVRYEKEIRKKEG